MILKPTWKRTPSQEVLLISAHIDDKEKYANAPAKTEPQWQTWFEAAGSDCRETGLELNDGKEDEKEEEQQEEDAEEGSFCRKLSSGITVILKPHSKARTQPALSHYQAKSLELDEGEEDKKEEEQQEGDAEESSFRRKLSSGVTVILKPHSKARTQPALSHCQVNGLEQVAVSAV